MKDCQDTRNLVRSKHSLAWALVALSGTGGLLTAVPADAQSRSSASVKRTVVDAPQNPQIKLPRKWQRVSIALTPEQQAELAKMGVKTGTLDITTYDISKLSGRVIN